MSLGAPVSGPAAVSDGRGAFTIETIDVASPQAGEVRVRVAAAGLCHTDHASLTWPGPLVLGHEGAGFVEAIGDGVDGFQVRQPVLMNWAIPCGICPQCARGNAALCDRTHETDAARFGTSRAHRGATSWQGRPIDRAFHLGTFARFTTVRAEALTALPAALPPSRACVLGCAVMTGVGSAINIAQVVPGQSVAVVGCGGVGLSVVIGARLAGAAQIIAIDQRRASLERAIAAGATHTILAEPADAQGADVRTRVITLTDHIGVDHAFEATGVDALSFRPLRLVRNGGSAIQVSGAHGQASVELEDFFWNKRYLASLYGGCVPSRDFPRLFDWVQDGAIDLDQMVGAEYRLDQLHDAMQDMLDGTVAKAVILIP